MAETLSGDLTPEKARIYWSVLKDDITNNEFEIAVEKILKSKTFFPRIAEIIDARKPPEETFTLARPGDRCTICGVFLNYPISRQRGHCGPCWRKVGGDREDNRREDDHALAYRELGQRRIGGPEPLGDVLGEIDLKGGES